MLLVTEQIWSLYLGRANGKSLMAEVINTPLPNEKVIIDTYRGAHAKLNHLVLSISFGLDRTQKVGR